MRILLFVGFALVLNTLSFAEVLRKSPYTKIDQEVVDSIAEEIGGLKKEKFPEGKTEKIVRRLFQKNPDELKHVLISGATLSTDDKGILFGGGFRPFASIEQDKHTLAFLYDQISLEADIEPRKLLLATPTSRAVTWELMKSDYLAGQKEIAQRGASSHWNENYAHLTCYFISEMNKKAFSELRHRDEFREALYGMVKAQIEKKRVRLNATQYIVDHPQEIETQREVDAAKAAIKPLTYMLTWLEYLKERIPSYVNLDKSILSDYKKQIAELKRIKFSPRETELAIKEMARRHPNELKYLLINRETYEFGGVDRDYLEPFKYVELDIPLLQFIYDQFDPPHTRLAETLLLEAKGHQSAVFVFMIEDYLARVEDLKTHPKATVSDYWDQERSGFIYQFFKRFKGDQLDKLLETSRTQELLQAMIGSLIEQNKKFRDEWYTQVNRADNLSPDDLKYAKDRLNSYGRVIENLYEIQALVQKAVPRSRSTPKK